MRKEQESPGMCESCLKASYEGRTMSVASVVVSMAMNPRSRVGRLKIGNVSWELRHRSVSSCLIPGGMNSLGGS